MASDGQVVAVLGAGSTMGFPMAQNMLKAGIEVRAWNRSPDKAAPLEQDGAHVFESAAEAVEGAGLVVTMLANAEAVLETIQSALARLGEGAVWCR